MTITGVNIVPSSIATIAGFRDALEEVAQERRYLITSQAPPHEETEKFIRSLLSGGGVQFVAIQNDKVIGWCDINRMKREGVQHCGTVGMGVLKSARGQGIGSALLKQAIDAAWQLGLTRIELEVFASNAPAIHLYKKLGFVVEGCKKQARILDGITDDMVCMALLRAIKN